MAKKDKPIDWTAIERDYRAGVMSNREIARWYGLSETAIRKKAKAAAPPWVRAKQPGHVEREPVRETVVAEVLPSRPSTDPDDLVQQGRDIAGRMLSELDAVTSHGSELEEMIFTEESDPRRRQALMRALSLSERATTLKNLTAAMKTLAEAGAPQGKKAEREAAAKGVGGKFGVRQPPRLVVDNQ